MDKQRVSIVVIGLNEENLIRQCLQSCVDANAEGFEKEILFVDSGSTDETLTIASSFPEVRVIELNDTMPSAAKARNLGATLATGDWIQFLDGDSFLDVNWLAHALTFIEKHSDIACVFGQLIERYPERNLYTRLCTFDWYIAPGEYRLCGGNALWRRHVLLDAGLFDSSLKAGEEPDLCYRARQAGYRIYCLDHPMAIHDLEMHHFGQYWKRGLINGKSYAAIGWRYRKTDEKLWFREMLRNFAEPLVILGLFLSVSFIFSLLVGTLLTVLVVLLRALRIAFKRATHARRFSDAMLYGLHSQFMRLPMFIGQLVYFRRHFSGGAR